MGDGPTRSRWPVSWRPPEATEYAFGGEHPLAHARRGTLPALPQDRDAPADDNAGCVVSLVLAAAFLWIPGLVIALSDEVRTFDEELGIKVQAVTIVLAALTGLLALLSWHRYWVVVDTPTVDVAGAHPGRCEVVGSARPRGAPAHSWFSGVEVVWSVPVVQAWREGWKADWQRFIGEPAFLLVGDDGHTLSVDPPWRGQDTLRPIVMPCKDGKNRLVENGLVTGDRLYVLGDVEAATDGSLLMRATRSSHRSEAAVAAGLRRRAVLTTVASPVLAGLAPLVQNVPSAREPGELARPHVLSLRSDALAGFATVATVAAVGFLVLFVWRLFNRLVESRERTAKAWSLVDVAAARRHDVITALVPTTAAAARHEVVVLRAAHVPSAPEVAAVDATLVGDSVTLAVVESNPELRSSAAFAGLFAEVRAAEDRMAAARRFYNDAVTVLADRAGTYPGLLLRRFVVPITPPLLRYGSDT